MSDLEFIADYVPQTLGARVQRGAVLYRLAGLCRSEPRIIQATRFVSRLWRSRLSSLRDRNWLPRKMMRNSDPAARWRALQYARNCLPAFVYMYGYHAGEQYRPRACRLTAICPFCWGRWAGEVFQRLDAAFPPPQQLQDQATVELYDTDGRDRRAIQLPGDMPAATPAPVFPYKLVERRVEFRKPLLPGLDAAHEERCYPNGEPRDELGWLQCIYENYAVSRRDVWRMIGPAGGFSFLTIEPYRTRAWHCEVRQLFMVLRDFHMPPVLCSAQADGVRVVYREFDRPARSVLARAVMRTCSYPRALLRGDADLVSLLLQARDQAATSGRRWTTHASTGLFRSSRQAAPLVVRTQRPA